MKTIIILFLGGLCFVRATFHQEFENYNNISVLKKAVSDIVLSSWVHDVTLIIDGVHRDDTTRLAMDSVIETVLYSKPTRLIDIQKAYVSKKRLQRGELATSRTLLIYIYTGRPLTTFQQKRIVINIWNASYPKEVPKLLTITMLDQKDANFNEFLDYLWKKRILHAEIIEVTYAGSGGMIVHQFNPFKNQYTKQPYSTEIELFPDKLRNLQGHPFYLTPSHQFPYIHAERTLNGSKLSGTMSGYLLSLSVAMNVTLQVIGNSVVYGSHVNHYPRVTVSEHDRFDTDLYTRASLLNSYPRITTVTLPIDEERTCFCVPILFNRSTLSLWKVVVTILAGSLAIWVFRLFLRAVRINARLANSINVIRLMLGIGVPGELTTPTEKILLLCLVVAATRYSSIFYTELFNLGVNNEQEFNIRDMESLVESNLDITVADVHYDAYLSDMEVPDGLKRRMMVFNITEYSKSISSFRSTKRDATLMGEIMCQLISAESFKKNMTAVKVSDFCPGRRLVVFPLAWKSPYVDRVNDVFLRVRECGLSHPYTIKIRQFLSTYDRIAAIQNDSDDSISSEQGVLRIVLFGYLISVLILITEIIVSYVRLRKLERGSSDRVIETNDTAM